MDPEVIGVRGAGLDPQVKTETQGPMGPVGPRGFPGRDGLSTTMGPLTSTGLGVPPVFNANLSTIGMENSLHYLGESLKPCNAIPTKCEPQHGRALKYDC